jgi:hypothetical protein
VVSDDVEIVTLRIRRMAELARLARSCSTFPR